MNFILIHLLSVRHRVKNLGVKAEYSKRCLSLIVLLSLMSNLHAQGLPSVKKVYTYETRTMKGHPNTFKLYYVIGDSLKNINGKLYNLFIFSWDSTKVTGYVWYDSSDKEMYIIYNHYHNNHLIITNEPQREQRYLSFFNDTLFDGVGGGDKIISYAKNHDSVIVMQIIQDSIAADTWHLTELIFFKGEFYPHSILIDDPFFPGENKDVVVIGR